MAFIAGQGRVTIAPQQGTPARVPLVLPGTRLHLGSSAFVLSGQQQSVSGGAVLITQNNEPIVTENNQPIAP